MQEPSCQHQPKHDPRDFNRCAELRHPTRAKEGRALRKHLAAKPFPRQTSGAQR